MAPAQKMNELNAIYGRLWEESYPQFQNGVFQLDSLILSPEDQRRGITLLARITNPVDQEISCFLNDANSLEPHQYYYPASDLHLTILSIITCVEGFHLSSIDPQEYAEVIRNYCSQYHSFKIAFRGLTASNSCIMVQGFPDDDQLNSLREDLREGFSASHFCHSIDSRYPIKTAHSTVIRFQNPVGDSNSFVKLLEKYRDHEFGVLEVNQLELVFNDWYQTKSNTILLDRFCLAERQ